jgi:diguanylate cyclase (GGDEF)-like protein
MTGHQSIPEDLVSMLDQLAHTIVTTLALEVAVVHLARSDDELEVVSVVGNDEARAALLGSVTSGEWWDACVSAGEPRGRLLFLDHDSSSPMDLTRLWAPSGPGSALLAPLTAADGSRLGILFVALPSGGHEPDTATCTAVEAFAVSTGMAIEHATMRSRAEASEQIFRSQAMSDPLTGIGSRTLLLDRLRHASTARPESGAVMALAFVDLDDFKVINDEHSHVTGDRVLRTVAQRIQTVVRAHDTVARWGGDEFVVLLHPLSDEHSALGVVRRILAAVAAPITDLGHTLKVTASVGLSFWTSDAPAEADELVRRADAAMYQVKRSGGDGYSVFDDFDAEAARRLHVLDLLSRAVSEQRVVVQYAPIVRVADGTVVGVEALLALRDDDDVVVRPFELLDRGAPPGDVAQEVLVRASEQVARWVDDGHDLSLSVNASPQHVADIDAFTANVDKALTLTGLAPERLVLELTEHALLSTTSRTLSGIDDLVGAGVRFSIGEFGTGYGSMTYFQVLPIHELKIDRSLLAETPSQRTAAAIIRSIASLASDLDMSCVAGGVVSEAQHDLVRAAGVTLAQGDYYSAALDADAFESLLAGAVARGATLALPGQ